MDACSKHWPIRAAAVLDRLHAHNGQTLGSLRAASHDSSSRDEASDDVGRGVARRPVRRGSEKLHYLNPVPIHEIAERWIGKFERGRLRALSE